ncbi:copper amine oxidase N-terminal domain-containing protein [Paenibacillus filicis]|uniref:Copper amine oxidase N-terminal domain-containing protein n=1 Tax=Paenibacillus gyeongsangnamensis TaxID=3388067 RepID=A0ABT4QF29_9BACL|nr:copper amine oxidase N-terminal domain-containing protein [Paenibacillus filicis]MCZ8515490.1 copper amine oxidase N-terminal domain-containing protein [Paenibacillus filicis]
MKPSMKKSLSILTLAGLMTAGTAYASPSGMPQNSPLPVGISASARQTLTITVNGKSITEAGFTSADTKELMLPLRAVTEELGFTLTWNQENLSVDLSKNNLFTTVKTGEDRYVINKMYTTLGTAPVLVDNKMYVPASFVSKILHGTVSAQGNSVAVSREEQQKKVQTSGVITAVYQSNNRSYVHIQGVGTDGLVLNVNPETAYQMLDGTAISLSDLHVGLTVSAEHSMAATLSLPPQTSTTKITVLDPKIQADLLGTAGVIEDIRTTDDGKVSLRINGTDLTGQQPSEVDLQLTDETALIQKDGSEISKSELVKGAKVIGFYGPAMTRSLPPIGKAWKVVVESKSE